MLSPRSYLPNVFALLLICTLSGSVRGDEPASDVDKKTQQGLQLFKKEVRPILIHNCLRCHGGEKVRGKFDLSTREALMKSGVVGKSAATSTFLKIVKHEEEPFMPKDKPKLATKEITALAQWIDLGTPYDQPLTSPSESGRKPAVTANDRQFWSFRPLLVSAPPRIQNQKWTRTPIDQFILAKLHEKDLKPNPIADRRKLIRRAYFDLTGLPPTPEEVEAFVHDKDPRAYEKVIDRLLESPQYGERWARHWMDVARFAESHGYEQDYNRAHAYHYRDFLIRALNQDMPYDQFVKWQLAGDELAPNNSLAMSATGFLGAGAFPTQLTEAEFERARYDELDDMVATTGVTFLGLSTGCARCHDHKFDPIPTQDYYRLASIFTTTIRSEIDLPMPTTAGKKVKVQVTSEGFPHTKHHADGRGYPHFYKETYQLNRGDVHQKKEVVQPGYLQVLMRNNTDAKTWKVDPPKGWTRTSFRRASFANWITDTEKGAGHLAARVMVNRLWQHHFGQGIVTTPNDFGMQGERPTHPKLLDWLAVDFVQNGWKIKRMHKLIMTSAVYLQSNDFDEARAKIDRENKYYWRRSPRRLEAEAIRDSMLAMSGSLDKTMYGPGTLDQKMKRRSIYFFIKRSKLIPMMMLFDWPEHLVSIGQRSETTIAPQALMFLNGPQAREYATGFATRVSGGSLEDSIRNAYLVAYGRPPSEREQKIALTFLNLQTKRYEKGAKGNAARYALVDLCQTLMSSNEFVYVD